MNLMPWRKPKATAVAVLAEPRVPTARPDLAAVALPGIQHAGGYLYDQFERERAWQDQSQRDETIRLMANDSVLAPLTLAVEMMLRRVQWWVEPADESAEAKRIAERVQQSLDEMDGLWPGDTMAQILTFLTWGWSALGVQYKRQPDNWIGWQQWRLIPQSTRLRWMFDAFDNPTGFVQSNYTNRARPSEIEVPLDRCILFRFTARDNSPEGWTPLRAAYDAYMFRRNFQEMEGILFERMGGIAVGRMPALDIKDQTEGFRVMQDIVTGVKIAAQSGMVLASDRTDQGEYLQDFELKAPQAGATVPNADPIIRRYAQEMTNAYMAAVTRTGQDGTGSYALADVQADLMQQGLSAHLDTIANEIQSQEFPRLMRLNGVNPKLTPLLKHGDIQGADLERIGAYVKSLADSDTLERSPELTVFLHEQGNLPVPSIDELKTREAEAAKAAADAAQRAAQAPPVDQPQSGNGPANDVPSASSGAPDGGVTLSELSMDGAAQAAMQSAAAAFDRVAGERLASLLTAAVDG